MNTPFFKKQTNKKNKISIDLHKRDLHKRGTLTNFKVWSKFDSFLYFVNFILILFGFSHRPDFHFQPQTSVHPMLDVGVNQTDVKLTLGASWAMTTSSLAFITSTGSPYQRISTSNYLLPTKLCLPI